jgi:hypothetical protein
LSAPFGFGQRRQQQRRQNRDDRDDNQQLDQGESDRGPLSASSSSPALATDRRPISHRSDTTLAQKGPRRLEIKIKDTIAVQLVKPTGPERAGPPCNRPTPDRPTRL